MSTFLGKDQIFEERPVLDGCIDHCFHEHFCFNNFLPYQVMIKRPLKNAASAVVFQYPVRRKFGGLVSKLDIL